MEPWIPVIVASCALFGAVIAAWIRDRNNPMAQVATMAVATTASMREFIKPLEDRIDANDIEIGKLRDELSKVRRENTALKKRVYTLEYQLHSAGIEPKESI